MEKKTIFVIGNLFFILIFSLTSWYCKKESSTTAATVLDKPTLTTPANNATDITLTPTLSWTAISSSISYTLQVSTTSTFSSYVFNHSGLKDTSIQIMGLTNNTVYYWRVRSENTEEVSNYSNVFSFTTLLVVPSLIAPMDSATGVSITPTLSWTSVSGATSYTLQVSTNSTFTSYVVNQSGVTTTSKQIAEISNSSTYFWRVSASNSGRMSDYSSVYRFSTVVSSSIEMVSISGGSFLMGDVFGDGGTYDLPQHNVTLSNFKMSRTEVTQHQWYLIMATNPSYFTGDSLPVEQVNWYDAISFCNKLSIVKGLTPCYSIEGNTNPDDWTNGTIVMNRTGGYRLPTEAEWEYAARGGGQVIKYAGTSDLIALVDYAWYATNTTHIVATKLPNSLGLCDMSGNVSEWCWDYWGLYSSVNQTNPTGPTNSSIYRVRRGGAASGNEMNCRVSTHGNAYASQKNVSYGFRLAQD